ncbi:hypothetical protein K3495_g14776 [Podosphaera aphanis]|nr:hypothetical protein K3495_g14776 [Podosphaera aphanis]
MLKSSLGFQQPLVQEARDIAKDELYSHNFLSQRPLKLQSIQPEKVASTNPPPFTSWIIDRQILPSPSSTGLSRSSALLQRASIYRPPMLRIPDGGRKSEGIKPIQH